MLELSAAMHGLDVRATMDRLAPMIAQLRLADDINNGSAAFFAVYHPPLSWLPVALLGAANALLFKKTGRLAPAVVLHMVYNAVVLS